jgi:hypothetical protein
MSTAICGATTEEDGGWQPIDAGAPTCRRCLRLLPKARERARELEPPDPPRPGAPLVLTCDWFRRLPRAYGRPDFPGWKIHLAGDDTFAELARLTWTTLGMGGVRLGDTYEADDGPHVALGEHPWRFTLAGGAVVAGESADRAVSEVLGRGEHLDFSWGGDPGYRAMLRVDR